MAADFILRRLAIPALIHGRPIAHGDFHNIAVLLFYAFFVSLLLHPFHIKLRDSFMFAAVGFAAHMFEDALVFNPAYPFLWPFSDYKFGIGLFNYSRDFYGIADPNCLIIGLIMVAFCAILRTAYEGNGWIKRFLPLL